MDSFVVLIIVFAIAGFPSFFFAKWLHKKMAAKLQSAAVLLSVLIGIVTFALLVVGEVCLFFLIFPLQR